MKLKKMIPLISLRLKSTIIMAPYKLTTSSALEKKCIEITIMTIILPDSRQISIDNNQLYLWR